MSAQPLWGKPVFTPKYELTAADLEQLPDDGSKYELIRGALIRMPPPKDRHENIAMKIARYLLEYLEQMGMEDQMSGAAGFDMTLPGEKDTVLAPDVSVSQTAVGSGGYSKLPPLLAVEVVSPSQYRPEMALKAEFYLNSGVKLVWIVWPDTRTVDVWMPAQAVITLTDADTITGGEVLPGFNCPLTKFFPKTTTK